jgi:hypothetical protein
VPLSVLLVISQVDVNGMAVNKERDMRALIIWIAFFGFGGTAHAALCDGTRPGGPTFDHAALNPARVIWTYNGPSGCNDIYNIRYGVIGDPDQQIKVDGASCPTTARPPKFCENNMVIPKDRPYHIAVQACHTRFLQSSQCSQWSTDALLLPYGPDTCRDGFVWRDAFDGDHVCVTSAQRVEAASENATASSRVSSTDHSYGPDTCVQGFVWRGASSSDHVCVTGAQYQETQNENAQAGAHRAS